MGWGGGDGGWEVRGGEGGILLYEKFGLIDVTRTRGNSSRIRFISTSENISKLRTLVVPHMYPCMLYKIGL